MHYLSNNNYISPKVLMENLLHQILVEDTVSHNLDLSVDLANELKVIDNILKIDYDKLNIIATDDYSKIDYKRSLAKSTQNVKIANTYNNFLATANSQWKQLYGFLNHNNRIGSLLPVLSADLKLANTNSSIAATAFKEFDYLSAANGDKLSKVILQFFLLYSIYNLDKQIKIVTKGDEYDSSSAIGKNQPGLNQDAILQAIFPKLSDLSLVSHIMSMQIAMISSCINDFNLLINFFSNVMIHSLDDTFVSSISSDSQYVRRYAEIISSNTKLTLSHQEDIFKDIDNKLYKIKIALSRSVPIEFDSADYVRLISEYIKERTNASSPALNKVIEVTDEFNSLNTIANADYNENDSENTTKFTNMINSFKDKPNELRKYFMSAGMLASLGATLRNANDRSNSALKTINNELSSAFSSTLRADVINKFRDNTNKDAESYIKAIDEFLNVTVTTVTVTTATVTTAPTTNVPATASKKDTGFLNNKITDICRIMRIAKIISRSSTQKIYDQLLQNITYNEGANGGYFNSISKKDMWQEVQTLINQPKFVELVQEQFKDIIATINDHLKFQGSASGFKLLLNALTDEANILKDLLSYTIDTKLSASFTGKNKIMTHIKYQLGKSIGSGRMISNALKIISADADLKSSQNYADIVKAGNVTKSSIIMATQPLSLINFISKFFDTVSNQGNNSVKTLTDMYNDKSNSIVIQRLVNVINNMKSIHTSLADTEIKGNSADDTKVRVNKQEVSLSATADELRELFGIDAYAAANWHLNDNTANTVLNYATSVHDSLADLRNILSEYANNSNVILLNAVTPNSKYYQLSMKDAILENIADNHITPVNNLLTTKLDDLLSHATSSDIKKIHDILCGNNNNLKDIISATAANNGNDITEALVDTAITYNNDTDSKLFEKLAKDYANSTSNNQQLKLKFIGVLTYPISISLKSGEHDYTIIMAFTAQSAFDITDESLDELVKLEPDVSRASDGALKYSQYRIRYFILNNNQTDRSGVGGNKSATISLDITNLATAEVTKLVSSVIDLFKSRIRSTVKAKHTANINSTSLIP